MGDSRVGRPESLPAGWLRVLRARYVALPAAWRWGLLLGWAALIWIASSRPGRPGAAEFWPSFLHNGAHVVVYGLLGLLWMLAAPGSRRARLLGAIAVAALYGAIDEWHQSTVPQRTASAADVLSDTIGAAWFGCVLLWVERPSRRLAWSAASFAPLAAGAVLLAVQG
jgi:VanZ family protein